MSTLPEDAPLLKKFKNGDHGWAHAAQEAGVYAVISSLLGWLLSPLLVPIMVAVFIKYCDEHKCLPYVGEKFWREREMDQTIARGRPRGRLIMPADFEVPDEPNDVWTLDAIEDVTTPRLWRPRTAILSVVYSVVQLYFVGFVGLVL